MGITWTGQKEQECWITAMAMVTGKTLDALHAEFTELAGKTYHEAKAEQTTLLWWNTVNIMHKRYHLWGVGGTFGATVLETPVMDGTKRKNLTTKMLNGKGILGVHIVGKFAHAVAFEDGFILDPEVEGRMTLATFRGLYRLATRHYTWRIDRVDPTKA